MVIKQRPKPSGLFCESCLEEVTVPSYLYFCEPCGRKLTRERVLTFDEMISAKFKRVKHRNLNQLKRDMRP